MGLKPCGLDPNLTLSPTLQFNSTGASQVLVSCADPEAPSSKKMSVSFLVT
ncbi:hypothetical protein HMI55_005835 [Coelomomyces lativittatus]|nr:hypothetical protein HMI55_005835 [Coelomomyces lativittatus]